MPLHIWLVYVGAVFLISGTPGPNMLLCMTHGIHHGLRETAISTMGGLLLGMFVILSISLGGLGAVLLASATAFTIIKYAGAVYLVYLGLRTWRGAGSGFESEGRPDAARGWTRFRIGLLIALSNPKAILFGVAFFPQFINPDRPLLTQAFILLPSFMCIEIGWMCVYAGGGAKLARWLKEGKRMTWFDRMAGSAFIGAGLALGGLRR
jgi:threonine/homoserine/homoserine lactone efflux protein